MTIPVRAIGMAWFRSAEDFAWARREFIDGHGLPATFEEWQRKAKAVLERLRASGQTVERVMIDPATFPAWCRENGFEMTSQARQHYSATMVRHLATARAH